MAEEERRLMEERQRIQDAEDARREADRQRLMEVTILKHWPHGYMVLTRSKFFL